MSQKYRLVKAVGVAAERHAQALRYSIAGARSSVDLVDLASEVGADFVFVNPRAYAFSFAHLDFLEIEKEGT
jgi:hypothetical protein